MFNKLIIIMQEVDPTGLRLVTILMIRSTSQSIMPTRECSQERWTSKTQRGSRWKCLTTRPLQTGLNFLSPVRFRGTGRRSKTSKTNVKILAHMPSALYNHLNTTSKQHSIPSEREALCTCEKAPGWKTFDFCWRRESSQRCPAIRNSGGRGERPTTSDAYTALATATSVSKSTVRGAQNATTCVWSKPSTTAAVMLKFICYFNWNNFVWIYHFLISLIQFWRVLNLK